MPQPTLTPEAKDALRRTIRGLRKRLLEDFHAAADSAYRLSVKIAAARLSQAAEARRRLLDGWLDEQLRTAPEADRKKQPKEVRDRFLQKAIKEAASTLLNRLVLLRIMEALSAGRPRPERLIPHDVITRGWQSPAYREFREYAPVLCDDTTEGYETLLGLMFDELAVDFPGLYGDVGLTRLFPIPPATLRAVVEALNDPALESAWTDDTTLGWVYQYWNDPEREALDAKIAAGEKIAPHEIASKTQIFTERYMVEWLLHNSLGLMWLCICKKHGWTADAESILPGLDARRAEWRRMREAGEVALDALMPIEAGLEERWKYFVPQPIAKDDVDQAPDSIRTVKILDPACGSGHFLVIAFDLLVELYHEEARHRGQPSTDRDVAESILENNLHGVDIDPRAVQLASAGLFLKARMLSRAARPKRVNLVAPALNLASLPANDPALLQLKRELREEAGISEALTGQLVSALAGVDHLGTLLKVDAAVDEAIQVHEQAAAQLEGSGQGDLYKGFPAQQVKLALAPVKRETVLEKLEQFLAQHSSAQDIGLKLDGEQLATGVRFVRIVKEGIYDLVVGNPPYQATSKMGDAKYVSDKYPKGKADRYAAFLERGLELARLGGMSALLTMRGWMFLGQFADLREHLLKTYGLRLIGDVDRGAFEDVPDEVISTAMTIIHRSSLSLESSVALQPTSPDDKSRDSARTRRKRAALLAQVGRFEFDTRAFEVIQGAPIVYWWPREFLTRYQSARKFAEISPARFGLTTGNNGRFVRFWYETDSVLMLALDVDPDVIRSRSTPWVSFVLGGKGRVWFEALRELCRWACNGLEVKENSLSQYGSVSKQIRNENVYFERGIAFAMIGSNFSARAHRYSSVIGNMGSSVYPKDIPGALCMMNSTTSRFVLESINPGVHFEVGDVNRLPLFPVENADDIYKILDRAFTEHEAARETSVEFQRPGPSPWTYAQAWAQHAVDRPAGEPLPPYFPVYEPPAPAAFVSFALGLALGRFPLEFPELHKISHSEQSVLHYKQGFSNTEPSPSKPRTEFLQHGTKLLQHGTKSLPPGTKSLLAKTPALPAGILFLSAASERDSLDRPACDPLKTAWQEHGAALGGGDDLRTYLRKSFFAHHKDTYENRPIYFPLSSAKKSFVAWVSIHRFQADTLSVLLADHLLPERRTLEGELEDLRRARAAGKTNAERRYAEVQKLLEELVQFIDTLTACAEKGPPQPDDKTHPREAGARFAMDLDDGVMVNSAALWPLLEPQWKDPKRWWKELANADGKKDDDWSHLAARYFPVRVDQKCQKDPSLAVAHRCFWRYHPAKAYAWELRLKVEIGPDFLLDEPSAAEHRRRFLKERAAEAREIDAKEAQRQERKKRKEEGREQADLPYDSADTAEDEAGEVEANA